MRIVMRKSLVLAAAFVGLCAGSARAEQEIAKVPFPFVVHGRTLPAGEYVVQPRDQGSAVMMIRGRHSNFGRSALVLTGPAAGRDPAGDKPALIFRRYENQYRLSTIWESGTDGRAVAG